MLFNLLVILALIGIVGATACIWGPILMLVIASPVLLYKGLESCLNGFLDTLLGVKRGVK